MLYCVSSEREYFNEFKNTFNESRLCGYVEQYYRNEKRGEKMPTYKPELRICKICGKQYNANVLMSSNTFSQSIESINEEIRRHRYWLCDSCWKDNLNKPSYKLKIYIPNESDYEEQKNVQKNILESQKNQSKRYSEYFESLKKFCIDYDTYTNYLKDLFGCLSTEVIAQNKPYKLYIDSKEFEPNYVWGKQTIGYLFDPTQKGPNISISYDLTTYSGNKFHMFPKIIVDSGYFFHITHAANAEVSTTIFGKVKWKIDVETHKKIRGLMKNSYSWMESNYIANDIKYLQHIYFSTNLIDDLVKVFDRYYDVFGKPFEKLRLISINKPYNYSVDENLEIMNDITKSEMRLFDEPFTDV